MNRVCVFRGIVCNLKKEDQSTIDNFSFIFLSVQLNLCICGVLNFFKLFVINQEKTKKKKNKCGKICFLIILLILLT